MAGVEVAESKAVKTDETQTDVLVLGAGVAGLSTAAMLERKGVSALVLERGDAVGMSWRNRYEGLRLNTLRWMSTPPGYRIPRRYGRWVAREDLVDYLEEYAQRERLRIRFGVEAQRIDRRDGGWRVQTSDGPLDARDVVVATGYDRVPKMPEWPGREGFEGELIHAVDYRSPAPYQDRDVLVVACGNTGSEIACLLARGGARRVWMSMRTPPNVFKRELFGMPVNLTAPVLEAFPPPVFDTAGRLTQWAMFGNLRKVGIPRAPMGLQSTLLERGVAPIVDDGFVACVKGGQIELVGEVEGFDGADVLLAGGDRIQPHAVIAATGYERGLEPLVGHLGVVDEHGKPVANGTAVPGHPGLWFIGYVNRISGQLRPMRGDARRIARAIARSRRVASAPA